MSDIIGLCGYARTGKDTVAEILVKDFGFTRVAFADKLREAAYALNPIVALRAADTAPATFLRVQDVVDTHGWDFAKTKYPEIRVLLQRLGTEVGRQVLSPALFGDDRLWIEAALNAPTPGHVVISDVRFPNEFYAIKSRGGTIWRILRPDTAPVNGHSSETALDFIKPDVEIYNDETVEVLRARVGGLL